MKKPVIITMRYSVLTRGTKSFSMARDRDFEDYKFDLFDSNRLNAHFKLFSSITLPSLMDGADEGNVRLYIITSIDLPIIDKKRLYSLIELYDWIRIVEVDEYEDINRFHSRCIEFYLDEINYKEGLYAHVRLDDDDALYKGFIRKLREYIDPVFEGYVISFSSGLIAEYNDDKEVIVNFFKVNHPFNALGLSFIGKRSKGVSPGNVYALGNHMRISEVVPTIVDGTFISYIRTSYLYQDTENKALKKVGNIFDKKNVLDLFSINI